MTLLLAQDSVASGEKDGRRGGPRLTTHLSSSWLCDRLVTCCWLRLLVLERVSQLVADQTVLQTHGKNTFDGKESDKAALDEPWRRS